MNLISDGQEYLLLDPNRETETDFDEEWALICVMRPVGANTPVRLLYVKRGVTMRTYEESQFLEAMRIYPQA